MKKIGKFLFLISMFLVLAIALAGCGGSGGEKPTAVEPKAPEAPKVVKAVSLVEQVKASGHYGFFKEMADGKKYPPARADACIGCHSAVKMLDDPNAKFADFQAGGKYAGKMEGITCRVCHELGGDKMISLRTEGLQSCGKCHTAEGIKEGKEVHHPQIEMIQGIQGVGVQDKPSRKMVQKFACYDCHFTNQTDHDFKAPTAAEIVANEKCSGCHTDAAAMESKLKAQKDKVKGQLDQLATRLEAAKKAVEAAKTAKKDVAAAEKVLGGAITNITYVQADKSMGVHNVDYVDELLKVGTAKLDEFDTLIK